MEQNFSKRQKLEESSKRVLVIGGGGREHALAWKLIQSPRVSKVFVSPGNGGTKRATDIENVTLSWADDFREVITFAKKENIDLVVVGPEQPLVEGITDALGREGIPCFGPSRRASEIEASKAFSKDFMKRNNIPTARYEVFMDYSKSVEYIQSVDFNIVLKVSGLAAGKGVLIPNTKEEALDALKRIFIQKEFGSAGNQVVIEERLEGPEVSILAFTDGYTIVPMPPAQDHKRIFDGDLGPNTGGMGAYAPSHIVSPKMLEEIEKTILRPTIRGLRREGSPYVGVLYAGLLLDKNSGINVLEFNCRMGDPETESILPLLDSDIFSIFEACVERRLDSIDIKWKSQYAVTVVMASQGYPGSYQKGKKISGLETISDLDAVVFHAGTKLDEEKNVMVTNGGRVLAVTALGTTVEGTIDKIYKSIEHISFEGAYYRKDIAKRALNFEKKGTTYADSGVSIDRGNELVESIKTFAKSTSRKGAEVSLGGFGGLFDIKAIKYKDPVLVSGTDGVGTKLLLSLQENKHDTIGIDLVAMCVNDIVVQGAEPLFFLDYFATGKLDVSVASQVISGIAKACKESGCALIGGETAEMPGMYSPGKYDMAGFAVGAVERDEILPKTVHEGDIVLGLASSGIHSNGYSLVRFLVEKHHISLKDKATFEPNSTLAQVLLKPTRIYVQSCLKAIKMGGVHALAHITGGGLTENIPRILTEACTVEIDLSTWKLPGVFKWLMQIGNIETPELLRTFNCGIGMVLIVDPSKERQISETLKSHGEQVFVIGKVSKRRDSNQVTFKNNFQ